MADTSGPAAPYSRNCVNCHDVFVKYKCMCLTCKTPCAKCTGPSSCSASTDTCDFEKYVESLTPNVEKPTLRKIKPQAKFKTVGTDTCDLDSHFDYYKPEKITIIQKSVATDCFDLMFTKAVKKKKTESERRVKHTDEEECEFTWTSEKGRRTYARYAPLKASKKPVAGEDKDLLSVQKIVGCEENKENYDSVKNVDVDEKKEITFDKSSSDESDVDLVTSSRISKCRKIARSYQLTLTQTEVDNGIGFKCSACGKPFLKKYLGLLHLADHMVKDRYKCLSCESSFTTLDLLTSHFRETHRGLVTNNSDNTLEEDTGKGSENEECANSHSNPNNGKTTGAKQVNNTFQCVLCFNANQPPAIFSSYKGFYLHKRLKHGVKETKIRSKKQRKPRFKREYVCLICGKEFKSNKALSDHLSVHSGEKNYLCDICNKSYTTNANLQIHKRTHIGSKNFKCTVCDKAFHKKDSLKVHFRKHSGERPYQCDLCPMTFDRNFILKNHRLRHFSEKAYICPVCGKTFTTHGGLNNHEKSHKRDPRSKTPRKPAAKTTPNTDNAVICDVCGKVYSTKSNLRMHKFIHLGVKPFQCPVCQQSYAKKDSMLTHMRKHTDERPFSCETCGMAFYRNHTLKTHRLRHTGERPHKCHICGKSFTQSSSLAYHVKHHDRKDEKKKLRFMNDQRKVTRKKFTGAKSVKVEDVQEKCDAKGTPDIGKNVRTIRDDNGVNYEKDFVKNPPAIAAVIKKEVKFEETLADDPNKKPNSESGVYQLEKDAAGQFTMNNLNYYIAKSNEFSLPKVNYKEKAAYRKDDVKAEQSISENIVIRKHTCITKDDNLLMNREIWMKSVKGFGEMGDNRTDGKAENALPITGEILNAAFISDENGDVIPFESMTLENVGTENIMISPVVKRESGYDADKRKRQVRCPRLMMIDDSKLKYDGAQSEKYLAKGECQVLNLKDPKMQQRIQLIDSDSLSFHIQVPASCTEVTDDCMMNAIPSTGTYYSNV